MSACPAFHRICKHAWFWAFAARSQLSVHTDTPGANDSSGGCLPVITVSHSEPAFTWMLVNTALEGSAWLAFCPQPTTVTTSPATGVSAARTAGVLLEGWSSRKTATSA